MGQGRPITSIGRHDDGCDSAFGPGTAASRSPPACRCW
jgi:hypothetical protein